MIIYHYDDFGEYYGKSQAEVSPLQPDVFLIPRNATTLPPPEPEVGKVAIFNRTSWVLIEDFRGQTWYKKGTREPVVIRTLGPIDISLYQQEPEPFSEKETWAQIRLSRDSLLAGSDWTQLSDAPVDKQAWASYRKLLRDIPQTFAKPEDVVWPEKP